MVMNEELIYLKKKVAQFTATEAPAGFTNCHGTTNDHVIKEMGKWLKSVFSNVVYSKAKDMQIARKKWGVEDTIYRKDRSDKLNHCIDAFIHDCISHYGLTPGIPYKEFFEDLKKIELSVCYRKQEKPFRAQMHSKRGMGYKKPFHGEMQHAKREFDGRLVVAKKFSADEILNMNNKDKAAEMIELIIKPSTREQMAEALKAGKKTCIDKFS
jgi:hypothetical protein